MSEAERALPTLVAQLAEELYVEFDGQQLTLATDVPEVFGFLERAFSAMLVPSVTESVGRVDFLRRGDGFVLKGKKEVDYAAPPERVFESIKDEVLLNFILARQDLMWIHAGAVEAGEKALLFAGPSGNGKSTMVTLLSERGWGFLSDDIAPIRMDANEVLPFPQTPRRRIHPRRELPPEAIGILDREAVIIDPGRIQRRAVAIGAIVFPVYRGGASAELKRVGAGEAAFKLIRDCTNFADHKAAAVARAVEMARTIPIYALEFSNGPSAASLLDSLR